MANLVVQEVIPINTQEQKWHIHAHHKPAPLNCTCSIITLSLYHTKELANADKFCQWNMSMVRKYLLPHEKYKNNIYVLAFFVKFLPILWTFGNYLSIRWASRTNLVVEANIGRLLKTVLIQFYTCLFVCVALTFPY